MLRRRRALAFVLPLAAVASLGLGACGDDDEATGPETTERSEDAVGAHAGASECSPVGEDLEAEAAHTVEVQLAEYAFTPAEVHVAPGIVTFAATNIGAEAHELAFLPGGGDVPFTGEGAPDEAALADAGAFELEAFPAGQDCRATYDLEAGDYTLFCIVEAPDGATHYEKGMVGKLTVS